MQLLKTQSVEVSRGSDLKFSIADSVLTYKEHVESMQHHICGLKPDTQYLAKELKLWL